MTPEERVKVALIKAAARRTAAAARRRRIHEARQHGLAARHAAKLAYLDHQAADNDNDQPEPSGDDAA